MLIAAAIAAAITPVRPTTLGWRENGRDQNCAIIAHFDGPGSPMMAVFGPDPDQPTISIMFGNSNWSIRPDTSTDDLTLALDGQKLDAPLRVRQGALWFNLTRDQFDAFRRPMPHALQVFKAGRLIDAFSLEGLVQGGEANAFTLCLDVQRLNASREANRAAVDKLPRDPFAK